MTASTLHDAGGQVCSKRIPGNALLFALATQGFETYHLLGHFVVTEDQRIQRAALVGLLELAFEAARAGIDLQAQVGQLITYTFTQGQTGQLGGFSEGAEVNVDLTGDFFRNLLQGFKQQHQALDTHGETDARGWLATHLLHQTVVTTTGTHGALGAQLVGDPFENGLAVVIQPANQLRVDHVRNAGGVQTSLQALEVHTGLFVQVVGHFRRIDQHGLRVGVLGIEHPQRVGFQTALAVFVQLVQTGREELDQRFAITSTGLGGAQAVELKLDRITDAQLAPQAPGQHDQLGVDVRTVEVEDLATDLMELAITAFLRTFVTEHRADVPEFLHLTTAGDAVLEHSTHAGRRAFRAQGQGIAVAVVEGVHLFFDDVGHFTNGALEQLGELDDRHADLLVTVVIQQTRDGALEMTPQRGLFGQDVVHATYGLQRLAHYKSLNSFDQPRAMTAASASTFSAAFWRIKRSSSSTRLSFVSFCDGLPSM